LGIVFVVLLFIVAGCTNSSDRVFWSPYEDLNWNEIGHYDSEFHTHPGFGDEEYDPHQTIDRYHEEGYKILTLAAHSYDVPDEIDSIYPWTKLSEIYETIKDVENPTEGNKTYEEIANEPYEDRDPRLYETVVVNGDRYQERTAELWIGGRERLTQQANKSGTGYIGRKFVLDITSAQGVPKQWPYLRLPEIYLSYAEALNEINGGPTPEAYEYVNKVRNRVDLGNLPTGLTQEEFREAVLRERALEFGYEEVRWYDVIRWKKEEVFKKTLHGMDITRNDDGSFNYDRWELPTRQWANDFSPKWYLSPFSRSEMLKGYLIQNPGW
jgi:hypothetical protein